MKNKSLSNSLKILFLLASFFTLFSCPFIFENTESTKDIELQVKDVSSSIKRVLNTESETPYYENVYYFSSSPSAVISLTSDITDVTWTITSSTGETYYLPFKLPNGTQIASVHENTINVYLSNFDTLATYSVNALKINKKASYKFTLTSPPEHSLSSSLSINYVGVSQNDDHSLILSPSTNKKTEQYIIPSTETIELNKGKIYVIKINDGDTNPFGAISWNIENQTEDMFFIKEDKSFTSFKSDRADKEVYLYVNQPFDEIIKVSAKAGDKQEKSFYIKSIDYKKNTTLNECFDFNLIPIVGGYRVQATATDSNIAKLYDAQFIFDNSSDSHTVSFNEQMVASYDYIASSFPSGVTSINIPVKVNIIANAFNENIDEADFKESEFTIKKALQTSIIRTTSLTPSSSLLLPRNSLRARFNKEDSFKEYANKNVCLIEITPSSLNDIEDIYLSDAKFVIEKYSNNETYTILERPYIHKGIRNTESVTISLTSQIDGGIYKAYIKDIKGYYNSSDSEISSSTEISISDISAEVQFSPERSISDTEAIYKVRVLNASLPSSDYMLYVKISKDAGLTWDNLVAFDGNQVHSTSRDDINAGAEITLDGNSYPLTTNSENVVFSSLIIATDETISKIYKPTTGITTEDGEFITTASLKVATPCSVNDTVQNHYNARAITIKRPNKSTSASIYFKKGTGATIEVDKFETNVPFGKIVEFVSPSYTITHGNADNEDTAIILVGYQAHTNQYVDATTSGYRNSIFIKSIDTEHPTYKPSYTQYVFTLSICKTPDIYATCFTNWLHHHWSWTAHHKFKINGHTGYYPQLTYAGLLHAETDALSPRNGLRFYSESRVNNETVLQEDKTAGGNLYVYGYYSKKGFIDSDIKNHWPCQEQAPSDEKNYVSWSRYPLNKNYRVIRTN